MQDGVNWRCWKWHSAVVNDVDYLDKVLLATTVFDYRMHKQHMGYKFCSDLHTFFQGIL